MVATRSDPEFATTATGAVASGRAVSPVARSGLWRLLVSVGLCLSLGFSLLVAAIWTVAFLSGGAALISVNARDEALVEIVALAVCVPLIGYATLALVAEQVRAVRLSTPIISSPVVNAGPRPRQTRQLLRSRSPR